MKQKLKLLRLIFLLCVVLGIGIAFTINKRTDLKAPTDPKITNLKLPLGFRADHLHGPSENGEGSWVSMTFDNKGRIIASDQYGSLYRMTVPAIGDTLTKTSIEKLDIMTEINAADTSKNKITMGYAHGLLYAFNSLYVMINHDSDNKFKKGSGLYRLEDIDRDDKFDKSTLLKLLDGEGEHGPHSIVLSPDKKSIFIVAGNFTKIPKMDSYRNIPDAKIDNLFPLIKDPNGHDNTVQHHGGWIAQINPEGTKWDLIASGFRNPFDIAFNSAGDLFTYDSDMEWDFGTPWYRPTRICHVPSGGEFGWRPGTDKWNANYTDNLPAIINVGQGSPTNLFYGGNARFPEKYRNAMFAFDWSFGIIYAVYPTPDGASYKATGEEFISGSPLPLTDGVVGPDGALYFLTGGRRLESDLYRVYYGDGKGNNQQFAAPIETEAQKTRKKLEAFHGAQIPDAVEIAWPYLKDSDRFIRYAARIAIEAQPLEQWQNKTINEKDPVILTQAAIGLARRGNTDVKNQLIKSLVGINFAKLTEVQQLDVLRAIELVFARMGAPGLEEKTLVGNFLSPFFPAKTNNLNKELSKLLVYVEAPKSIEKTMALLMVAKDSDNVDKLISKSSDLILRNPQYGMDIAAMLAKIPPMNQTWYANVLSQAKTGWSPALQKQYFEWYYKAFSYKGGVSFVGFIDKARKNALENVAKTDFEFFNKISGDSIVKISRAGLSVGAVTPKGPGRRWKLNEGDSVLNTGLFNRNFEQGKAMFASSLCVTCHQIKGDGGIAGPDLTQLGTRFSNRDMLESIIEPSKTISDQYGSTVFYLKAGGSVVGRLIRQDNSKYYISQNPFATQIIREIPKNNVTRTRVSEVSAMLPGLINGLNAEELKDLIAYLKSGGNQNHAMYSGGN